MAIDNHLPWQYDEFKQVGTDYGDKAEVAIYDSSHADFRDMDAGVLATYICYRE